MLRFAAAARYSNLSPCAENSPGCDPAIARCFRIALMDCGSSACFDTVPQRPIPLKTLPFPISAAARYYPARCLWFSSARDKWQERGGEGRPASRSTARWSIARLEIRRSRCADGRRSQRRPSGLLCDADRVGRRPRKWPAVLPKRRRSLPSRFYATRPRDGPHGVANGRFEGR